MKWFKEIDRRSKLTALLIIVMVAVIYVLFKLTDNADNIVKWSKETAHWITVILKPVIIGFVVAYILFPIMHKIELLLKKIKFFKKHEKVTKGVSVAIVVISIVAVFSLFITVLVSVIKNTFVTLSSSTDGIIETCKNLANTLNSMADQLADKLNDLNIESEDVNNWISSVGDVAKGWLIWLANFVIKLVSSLPGIFTTLIFSVIFAIYFLIDGEAILIYWRKILRALLGKKYYGYVKQFAIDADNVFSGYIRGQVTDAVFIGAIVSLVFSIFKIKYAVLIGVLTGIGNLVPYLGPVLGYGTIVLTSVITGDFKSMALAIVLMFIIQTVDGNVINPKFLSDAIKVHPLLVLFSLIVGGRVGGFLGMLLAVPCGALIKIWFERLVKYIDSNRKKKEKEEAESAKNVVEVVDAEDDDNNSIVVVE